MRLLPPSHAKRAQRIYGKEATTMNDFILPTKLQHLLGGLALCLLATPALALVPSHGQSGMRAMPRQTAPVRANSMQIGRNMGAMPGGSTSTMSRSMMQSM